MYEFYYIINSYMYLFSMEISFSLCTYPDVTNKNSSNNSNEIA